MSLFLRRVYVVIVTLYFLTFALSVASAVTSIRFGNAPDILVAFAICAFVPAWLMSEWYYRACDWYKWFVDTWWADDTINRVMALPEWHEQDCALYSKSVHRLRAVERAQRSFNPFVRKLARHEAQFAIHWVRSCEDALTN